MTTDHLDVRSVHSCALLIEENVVRIMDDNRLSRQVAVRIGISNLVLPAGLLLCLLPPLLAVDYQHVNAEEQAAATDNATYD